MSYLIKRRLLWVNKQTEEWFMWLDVDSYELVNIIRNELCD